MASLELDIPLLHRTNVDPAVQAASKLVAIAHGRASAGLRSAGRRVADAAARSGLSSGMGIVVAVLDAHARPKMERDRVPAPVQMSDDELNVLGDKMRRSGWPNFVTRSIEKLHVKGRTALLRTF